MSNKQNLKSDNLLHVYDAEIMEEENKNDIKNYISTKPLLNKTSIAQKIGKSVGTIVSIAGLLSELVKFIPGILSKNNPTGNQDNKRKQRRRLRLRK